MRKRIALESFCLQTRWPLEIFDSFTSAGAAGFSRSAIGQVLGFRRKSHRGRGWRPADPTSRLGEFVRLHCVEAPDATVPLAEFVARFQEFSPGADAQRVELRIKGRYPVRLKRYGSSRQPETIIEGLNCRAATV